MGICSSFFKESWFKIAYEFYIEWQHIITAFTDITWNIIF